MKPVGGLLLAAGQSSRMPEGRHKLLAEFDGVPLIRRSAETMLRAGLGSVTVVTGHRSADMEMALKGLPLFTKYNRNFGDGMGSSLACGFTDLSAADYDGILVMLADMPDITTGHITKLLAVFRSGQGALVRGSHGEQPGHPVIVPSAIFSQMRELEGDKGARHVIQHGLVPIKMVDLGSAALTDVDTAEDLACAGGNLCG